MVDSTVADATEKLLLRPYRGLKPTAQFKAPLTRRGIFLARLLTRRGNSSPIANAAKKLNRYKKEANMPEALADDYGLSKPQAGARIEAPVLPYLPRNPKAYNPAIGVIGCGGIAVQHLNAYRHAA